ncbi:hypothetical protein [Tenacibaculum caenipelagi]|uniref:Uncharacterized protein n=1 Tax=Tenacibaculum caenipelagi TaxID=1325435 RepID=A0A4R6TDA6_9FLAO|nr:hypothetical protein [Tenacibaculum caenipelagi]TDQ27677.1 hypothetical protein DFQ07_1528 [Tenacibaculum caenipelagi]
MKLESKHITPYLEHQVKCVITDEITKIIDTIDSLHVNPDVLLTTTQGYDFYLDADCNDCALELALRPLSYLKKRFLTEHGWIDLYETFNENERSQILRNDFNPLTMLSYTSIQRVFEWHFDVFGLIEKGLAVDINTLNK